MSAKAERSEIVWRPMSDADLPRVLPIAAEVHPAYPEDAAIFGERLRLYPQGCHVLERHGTTAGYIISHPWTGAPPALNTLLERLPSRPSTYYIHDLALLPAVRGGGAADPIVTMLIAHARREKFTTISLTAVNNSEHFWAKHGFAVVYDEVLTAKLQSYGEDARLMRVSL